MRSNGTKACVIDGCERPRKYRELCGTHYERQRRLGSLADPRLSPADRFWSHVARCAPDDCWLWTGTVNANGYATFRVGGRGGTTMTAQRFAYLLAHGSVPDGLEIDHLCRTPTCMNPRHLEAVTHRVNVLRGSGISAENARKTHCKHGHAFDEVNTYRDSRGHRKCRTCRREGMATRNGSAP